MRTGALSACTKEREDFPALCSDVLRWDADEESTVLALAAALRKEATAQTTGGSASSSSAVSLPPTVVKGEPMASPAPAAPRAVSDAEKAMRKAVRDIVGRSQRAYGVLYECIPDDLRQQCAHVHQGYAYGLWKWLETKLQPTETDSVNALCAEFFRMAQEADESFDAYRARVNKLDARLTAAKARPLRAHYSFVLLDNLQPRYTAAVLALRLNGSLKDADTVQWDTVAATLNQHERDEARLAGDDGSSSSNKAMALQKRNASGAPGAQRGAGGGFRGGRGGHRGGRGGGRGGAAAYHPNVECYRCHEMGHYKSECPKPRPEGAGGPAPAGGREGQRAPGGAEYASAARTHEDYEEETDEHGCAFSCRVVGMGGVQMGERAMAASGPADAGGKAAGGERGAKPPPLPLKRLIRPGDASPRQVAAAAAPPAARKIAPAAKKQERPAVTPRVSLDKVLASNGWGLDTMASLNVSGNKEVFNGAPKRCSPVKIEVADGAWVVASHRGSVTVSARTADDTKTVRMVIDNVYFHERFKVNLLSWDSLRVLGWEFHSTSKGTTLKSKGGYEFRLRTAEKVSVLEGFSSERLYSAVAAAPGTASMADMGRAQVLVRLHERLGHIGFDGMIRILKAGKTRGFEKIELSDAAVAAAQKQVRACTGCVQGKGHRVSFGHEGLDKGTAPFEVIHMDTFEVRDAASGKMEYGLVMVDAHSGARWFNRSTNKDLIATQVLSTLVAVQTQARIKVARLHTDGGSEFINKTLKDWCATNGTLLQHSPARTQELNGVAERSVRTDKDGARTMLMHCGLPTLKYWARAMEHFVYMWNRTYISPETGMTPYEAMFRRVPSVKYLHVFGCDVYCHVPKEQRATFEAKMEAGIYLGHDDVQNCAVVQLLRNGKVIRTRDVDATDDSFVHARAISEGADAVLQVVALGDAPENAETVDNEESVKEQVSGDKEQRWTIECIVDRQSRMIGRGQGRRETDVQYRVRWENWGEADDTWESAERLIADGAQATIDEYERGQVRPADGAAAAPSSDGVVHMVLSALQKDTPPSNASEAGKMRAAPRRGDAAATAKVGPLAMSAVQQSSALNAELPLTHGQAVSGRYGDAAKWAAASDEEIAGCIERGVWSEVRIEDLPADANVLPCKWVYKLKTDEHGKVTAYKARLTPKGFKQLCGLDYNEVFAPTGKYKAMRVAIKLAVAWDYEIEQLDVKQAFLYATLKERVYMEMPEGYKKPGVVLQLHKALYGLKQAPREWHQLIDGFLRTLGFTPTVSDPCLYTQRSKGGQLMMLFLFVDDMQVSFHRDDAAEWAGLKERLLARFDTKDMGTSTWMLAMSLKRNRAARTATLDQELYVTQALARFGLSECKTAPTPESTGQEEEMGGDEPAEDPQRFMELVGTLLYAAICTRPDIMHAVMRGTRALQAPLHRDVVAAERVLRYLAGTKTMGLTFGGAAVVAQGLKEMGGRNGASSGGSSVAAASSGAAAPVRVSAFADADWANDRNDRRSVSGWVVKLDGDVVSWSAKKQGTVAQSTCEAELYAEGAAINEVLWQRGLLGELGVLVADGSVVHGDNQSTIAVSKNGVKSERTKHIDIKWHFIMEKVKEGIVQLVWISTDKQQADIFTKPLPRVQFEALRKCLMGC